MRYLALLAAAGLILAVSGTAEATTLTVGPGQTYTTIQAAVNAATSYDTIDVLAGTYSTNPTHTQGVVHVYKPLTIQGSGPGIKLVDGGDPNSGGFWTGFNVQADHVTISGFSVTAQGQGIWLETASHTLIQNNIVYGAASGYGIRAVGNSGSFTDVTLQNNTSYNNLLGIGIMGSGDGMSASDIDIVGNILYGNTNGISIEAGYGGLTQDVSVSGNNLYNNTSVAIFSRTWRYHNWPPDVPSGPWGTFSNISITGNYLSGVKGVRMGYAYDAGGAGYVYGVADVSAFQVNYNNIVGETEYLASNVGAGTLDAEYNWWGDASGPNTDYIDGDVDYTPWLTAPIPEPLTMLGMFLGLGSVGAYIRKRRMR